MTRQNPRAKPAAIQFPTDVRFSAKVMTAAKTCMAVGDIRYYLNGVYVEPHKNGVIVASTDGHRMLVIHDRNGRCDSPGIIDVRAETFAAAAKNPEGHICLDGGSLFVTDRSGKQAHIQPLPHFIDGTFPDWRKPIPVDASDSSDLPAIDAKYFATVGAIAKAFRTRYPGVTQFASGADSAVVFRPNEIVDDMDWLLVVMPMRATPVVRIPDWIA